MMNANDIKRSSMLDLLFAGRNQQYGAYVLRKYYERRLSMALGLTMAAVLLVFFLVRNLNATGAASVRPVLPDVIINEVDLTHMKEPELPPQQKVQQRQYATEHFTTNIVIDKTVDHTDVADNTKLQDALIGVKQVAGPAGPPDIQVQLPVAPKGPATPPQPAASDNGFVEHPSVAPEFPGGQAAWINFLLNNIHAPGDMEAGDKRSVLIRFIVSEEGAVTGLEVVRSGGASFDNEVLRVLRKMPRWKPARQEGRAVATSFVQPVTFQVPEE